MIKVESIFLYGKLTENIIESTYYISDLTGKKERKPKSL